MTDQLTPQGDWVILEAMGHQRVAGLYFFENGLHRVDVPAVNGSGRFIRTERYGAASIFRITSVDKETALMVAKTNVIPEAIPWNICHELKQLAAPQEMIEASVVDDEDEDGGGDFYDEF